MRMKFATLSLFDYEIYKAKLQRFWTPDRRDCSKLPIALPQHLRRAFNLALHSRLATDDILGVSNSVRLVSVTSIHELLLKTIDPST